MGERRRDGETANRRPKKSSQRRGERGVLLIDCLVYIGVFFLVLTVAFSCFYNCWDGSLALRRNTDDITSALRAGEMWRADVRAATGPLRAEDTTDGQLVHIPEKAGEVIYKFAGGSLSRGEGKMVSWQQILPKVKSSRMEPERRRQVTAWRWEIELPTKKKTAQVHPLFTFEAVPNVPPPQ